MKVTVSLETNEGGTIAQSTDCVDTVESFVAAIQNAMEHVGSVATHLQLMQMPANEQHGEHEAPEPPPFVPTNEVPTNHIEVIPGQPASETE